MGSGLGAGRVWPEHTPRKPSLAKEYGLEEGKRGGELEDSWEAADKIQSSMPDFGS